LFKSFFKNDTSYYISKNTPLKIEDVFVKASTENCGGFSLEGLQMD